MIAPGHHNMKPRAKVPVCLRASANRANNPLQLTGSNKFNPRASIILCTAREMNRFKNSARNTLGKKINTIVRLSRMFSERYVHDN